MLYRIDIFIYWCHESKFAALCYHPGVEPRIYICHFFLVSGSIENWKNERPVHICARAVLGEYRPEVLTVRTERSEVRSKRPRTDILPVRSWASLVNKRFITGLKKAKTVKKQVRDHSGQCPVRYLENIGPAIEHFDWLILVIGPLTTWVV